MAFVVWTKEKPGKWVTVPTREEAEKIRQNALRLTWVEDAYIVEE